MKKPTVFSLVHDQSIFMTIIMGLLTFLSVLALGIALSIGTGAMRWNSQWELFATIQISNPEKVQGVKKTITDNSSQIDSITEVTQKQMQDLMAPWISGGGVLKNYLPQMWEVKFKSKSDLESFAKKLPSEARFLTHATALKASTSAGWKMILISTFILILTLGAIGVCISYIARNTAMLHKRELEILNQIGASDNFVARQMQIIVAKISITACGAGFLAATPILLLILGAAHSARVGLMAMLGISGTGWFTLMLLPILIIVFSIWITKKTTIKILENS
jgi:cell division protein FtsX